MDLIVFENSNPFMIDEFRNASPPLTRAGFRGLRPVDPSVPQAEARGTKCTDTINASRETGFSGCTHQPLDSSRLVSDAGGMETPRKRPWWRYMRLSVRGLILVILAVGGCLGWWLERARVQRKAVAAIRAAGGWITYEWDVPGALSAPGWRQWVAEHVDVDLTSNIVRASLSPSCGDSELALVAQFDRLESLDVRGANVTDAGMASLRRLTRLRSLYLADGPITDAALVHLEALTGLEILSLNRTPVTDAGLVHLKGLARLRMLELASTQVGDAGLASLEGHSRAIAATSNSDWAQPFVTFVTFWSVRLSLVDLVS